MVILVIILLQRLSARHLSRIHFGNGLTILRIRVNRYKIWLKSNAHTKGAFSSKSYSLMEALKMPFLFYVQTSDTALFMK